MGPKLLSVLLSFQRAGRDGAAPIGLNGTRLNWVEHCESSFEELRTATMDEVVWVPLSKVRTVYGLAMTPEQHPFVRYLRDGFTSLLSFYRIHQPSSLPELFFLPNTSFLTSSESHSTRTWPWSPRAVVSPMKSQESDKWCGPADRRFISQVARRIDRVSRSIQKNGLFVGESDPPSYFLLSMESSDGQFDYRVVLNGGNHRVAALSHLGWQRVPLKPLPYFVAPEVRLGDIGLWPGVIRGEFSEDEARRLFMAFFRDGEAKLLETW